MFFVAVEYSLFLASVFLKFDAFAQESKSDMPDIVAIDGQSIRVHFLREKARESISIERA